MTLQEDEQEQEDINNFFSEFDEDMDIIIQNLDKSTKIQHEPGLNCWCYKNKGYWILPIRIDGFTCGAVWSNCSRPIFCFLCMFDEYEVGAPFHHVSVPMYTDEEFVFHVMHGHTRKPMSWYRSRLPHTKEPGWITIRNE